MTAAPALTSAAPGPDVQGGHDENLADHRLLVGPGPRACRGRRRDGRQAGDPAKAVAVMLRAIDAEHPPLHLPIGPGAHAIAERKLASLRADLTAWRAISIATDFDTRD